MNGQTWSDVGIPFDAHGGYRRPVQLRILGPLEVTEGNGPIPLGGPKQRAVLAHLLLRANHLVPTETLIDEVWGEEPPEAVRNSLQSYASHLRKALGPERLEGSRAGYVLRADPSEVDAFRFQSLLRDARRLLPIEPKAAVGAFDEALALWRGPAFADLGEERSLLAEAARLDELRLAAIEDRTEAMLTLGEHAEVIGELEMLTANHPLRERLWGQLVLALYRAGRQAEALAAFERARQVLAEELGIDPSPELRRLHERILRQSPELEISGSPLRGYRLLERIGAGSSGAVWRALQPEVGRDVAIKAIHPHLANDRDFIRRFEAEAQIVARLEHPHVVPLYDYWREPGGAYLVMRFLRGGNLAEALAGGPLELDRVAMLLDQMCGALTAADHQGVVHRDVKPSNILLDEEGNAYLADFGIAKDMSAPDATEPAMVKGTLAYLAPEQIRGGVITPRTDMYALGLVLYEVLVGEHPFSDVPSMAVPDRHLHDPLPSAQERRRDLPPGVDEVIATATAKDPELRFPDALAMASAFRAALTPADAAAAPTTQPVEVRNPYKGLRPFAEADAHDFFGREAFVERLLDRWRRPASPAGRARFIAVVGPSGSGKSSAVRAGLVPALRAGAVEGSAGWFITEMVPGRHPMEELEAALLRVAAQPPAGLLGLLESGPRGLIEAADRVIPGDSELVLVVDQFEEVFTLTESEAERSLLLESLRVAVADPASRVRVIATLRGDFYDRPLNYQRFGELLGANTEVVTPLAPDELERAIVGPAEPLGLRVDPSLVAQVASDVAEQPGALPLVQYALTELFERREDGRLALTAYRDIGGVAGALAARAEQLHAARDAAGREAMRQLFLRLVTLGEGTADTRRRVPQSELAGLEVEPEAVRSALDAFGRHRLLTFDRDPASREPTVEVAHEALLRSWPRLREWIDAAREDVRTLRRLADAGTEWKRSGRESSFLLTGSRLDQSETWAATTSLAIGHAEREYLRASMARREQELVAEETRAAREAGIERRSVKRLRALVAVLTAAAVVAGTLTAIALDQNANAQRATRLAAARELASAASAVAETDPQLAALLSLESIETTASDGIVVPDAEAVLRRAFPLTVKSLGGYLEVSLTPDLRRVAIVAETGPTAVWKFATDHPGLRVFTVPTDTHAPSECPTEAEQPGKRFPRCDAVLHAALSPDGSLLATGHRDRFVRVWDLASGRTQLELDLYANLSPASDFSSYVGPFVGFSSDGRYLWTEGWYGGMHLWDLDTGAEVLEAPHDLWEVAFSRDGTRLALAGLGVQVWNLDPIELLLEIPTQVSAPPSFAPDGSLVAIAGNGLRLVDLVGGAEIRELPGLPSSGQFARDTDLAFSPDGAAIAATSLDRFIRVWDVETGEYATLASGLGPVTALAWSPDSRYLATGGKDGLVRMWDVDSGRVVVAVPTGPVAVEDLAFTPGGERLAVASDDGTVALHIVDLEDLIELARDRLSRGFTDQECREYLHLESCPTL